MLPAFSAIAAVLTDSSNSNYTPTFPGVAWIVCYSNRRKAIGGWLMFYYWSLYVGIFVSIALFAASFNSYIPESFDNVGHYHLFLVSAVPFLVLYCMEVIVATLLLSVRTADMLGLLRGIMVAGLASCLLGLLIDIAYFRGDNIFLDVYTLICSIIWALYFFMSKRVAHVFSRSDWDSVVLRIYPSVETKSAN